MYSCTFERQLAGLLSLRNGAISHNQPQIASDRTVHEKLHNFAALFQKQIT